MAEAKQYAVQQGQSLNDVPTDNKKALAGGAVTTVVAFLGTLKLAMPEGVTGSEWVDIALATVIGAATGFGVTYLTPTKIK
jgi:hypothetical protein